jgi:alkanesulfonate monooxygenase SsuD/methylene tetrahydromethanopterin reductase-like flavin-dependent oxidoreductase (luciferase family)
MDSALFYEIVVPRPWHERSEYDAYKQTIEQAILSEEVGFSHFWTVEHHFLSEFSHCSAPECLYPYIAAKTKTLRLGHGVRLLPFPYNHPIRVAEMAATLDLVSDGRLEFGTGRSLTWEELGGFGIDPAEKQLLWEEALEIVVGAWTEETFSWKGRRFEIPPRNVIPKPLQKPHPPLWCATTSPEAHEICGRQGLGLLSFTLIVDPEELARRIALYRKGLESAKPIGKFVNSRAGTFTITHCAETNAEARRNAEHAAVWYVKRALEYVASVPAHQQGVEPASLLKPMLGIDPDDITFDFLDENDMVIVGDPVRCAEKVERYQAAGVDMLMTMMQAHGLSHEQVSSSIRLWGEHVIPKFS